MSSSDDSSERRANQRKNMSKKIDEWGEQNSIAGQILRVIKQCSQNPHGMHQVRQHKPLKLKIIQKKPLYLSDGTHCIQSSRQPLPQIQPNPFNTLQTQFYAGHSKPHIVFNCHDEIVEQQKPLYPSAYHPAYHYKSYEQFEERRKTTKVLVSCEKIQVTCWSIHIVNISRSGYYGPVLVIHDSRKGKGENIVIEKRVENILFYQQISPYLDDFRVRDMRKINLATLKNQFSLVYYMRDRKGNKKTQKLSNFSSLDTKNNILDSNPNLPVNFITFGQMSQYEIFKRPIHPKYLNKKKQINLDMYLEQNQRIDRNQANESEDDINSNSSSFIQDYNYHYHQNYNQRYMMEDQMEKQNVRDMNYQSIEVEEEDDQIDEQDDYLKKVYEKAMKNSSYM